MSFASGEAHALLQVTESLPLAFQFGNVQERLFIDIAFQNMLIEHYLGFPLQYIFIPFIIEGTYRR
jgi:hypothetical protein